MPIHFTSDQLTNAVKALRGIPGGVERAAVPAINRACLAARVFGVRRLAETYTAGRSNVIKTVKMTRATTSSLSAEFKSRGSRLPLVSFSVKPLRSTTRREQFGVEVRRGSVGKIKRGFVNVVGGGSRLAVLQRVGQSRSPVRTAFGPAVPQMLDEVGVRGEIEGRASDVLSRRFDHEIGRLLRGMR